MRTALLMNINLKATEEDVCEFFEKRKMKVLDVRMISDKDKRKHKGTYMVMVMLILRSWLC